MKKYFHFVFISLFIILIKGCGSAHSDNGFPEFKYTVLLGSGGGFTGNYEGIFIDSTGNVFKWTGRTFDSARKSLSKRLNKDEISSVINLIDTSGVQNINYSEHGNISSFIIIRSDKKENRISWNGLEPDSRVPENIRRFYSAIKQVTD